MVTLLVVVFFYFQFVTGNRFNWTPPSPSTSQCYPKCPSGSKCILNRCVLYVQCPPVTPNIDPPPSTCPPPRDPNNQPRTELESWFTKEAFNDLFPYANVGWGPHVCFPYNYESFIIAARYFPNFGVESPSGNGFNIDENRCRDVAAFFAHSIQETGLNDISVYSILKHQDLADACFYRGGLYNWFEGGPVSAFLQNGGRTPADGGKCNIQGRYCDPTNVYQCNNDTDGTYFKGCYFGRGAIQISYNFNYGQFQEWLHRRGIPVDLLKEPNLIMTKTDPPLAILASLWFYMTPQPPKPAMHDIIMGNWKSSPQDASSGYKGPIFGPTSLIINNECHGEDTAVPGGGGENRRIKAFKWFSKYFRFRLENDHLLSCKNMKVKLGQMRIPVSYAPDWSTTWKDQPCDCAPAEYAGPIPYFASDHYPKSFTDQNKENRKRCVRSVYKNPKMWNMDNKTSPCLNYRSDI